MVIDIHRHFWRGNQRYYDAQAAADGAVPEKPDWETTAQEHAAEMETSGVDERDVDAVLGRYAARIHCPSEAITSRINHFIL